MASVTLTTFMDYVVASGTRKITLVKNAKTQYKRGYDPRTDFYKPLREGIIEMHRDGYDLSHLDGVLSRMTDAKKLTSYPKCIEGYAACLEGKRVDYSVCKPKKWASGGLEVRVNPELLLTIDGEPYMMKLYFKADPIPRGAVAPMLRMIQLAIPRSTKAKPAILDLQHGKLHTRNQLDPTLDALLQAEAASFALLWETLS